LPQAASILLLRHLLRLLCWLVHHLYNMFQMWLS
jgi:hypothetical protein